MKEETLIRIGKNKGLLVEQVSPDSIGHHVGLGPGDRILSINGNLLRDPIDYKFHVTEENLEIKVLKKEGTWLEIEIEKDADDDLGIEIEGMKIRQCPNKCVFCFVDQNPKGARKALYIRDEDYRFSFMYGNYITLTNLSSADRERIFSQRLSPLYVSVHTTDNDLRRSLLKNPKAPDILKTIKEFLHKGITLHTQIVVCPGLNDGAYLEKSIEELASLYPGISSLAIVPVGLTKHRDDLIPLQEVSEDYARQMIQQILPWQKRFYQELGTSFVFPSDEFFTKGRVAFPPLEHYEERLQLENGVGMVPLFLEGTPEWMSALPQHLDNPKKISLVTGFSFENFLRDIISKVQVGGLSLEVYPISNDFFGEMVTVAGLLTGTDIITTLRGKELGDLLVIPSIALNDEGTHFLDDLTPEDVKRELGVEVQIVDSTSQGLWEMMGAVHSDFGKHENCGDHRASG